MIYSVNIVTKRSGNSILDVDCSGCVDHDALNLDLFTSFLKAMDGLGSELFKGSTLKGIDFGNFFVKKKLRENYEVVMITDKNHDENGDIEVDIFNILDEFDEMINIYISGSKCFRNTHQLRIKLIDVMSSYVNENIENDSLIALNQMISDMINQGNHLNLYTKQKLLNAKIKLGRLLDKDVLNDEKVYKKTSETLDYWIELSAHWLRETKNCIYEEYMSKDGISWAKVYLYLCNFGDTLKKITRSEIAEKYLSLAKKVIDHHTSNNLDFVRNEIVRMDDSIQTYIKF